MTSVSSLRRTGALVAVLALVAAGLATRTSRAAGEPDVFTFWPTADTYVDGALPTSAFGGGSSMAVDSSSLKQSFVRFSLDNLDGRVVSQVTLRLYQTDSSPSGGRVRVVGSSAWSETTTWGSRPPLGGVLATIGPVAKGQWYEVPLGPDAVAGDGAVAFALDSTQSDGAKWGTRESSFVPQLFVEVDPVDGLVVDGLSRVTHQRLGSSDPTYHSNQHRLALTSSGRLLAVHGRHGEGVQLAWRDPGAGWRNETHGAVGDGLLLRGTGSGDWNASIAIGQDATGEEHAWVVWSKSSISSTPRPVQMRRLSDLSSPGGPTVGPVVTVDAPAAGAARADIAFEPQASGGTLGVLTWLRKNDDGRFDLMTGWFDPDAATPTVQNRISVWNSSSQSRAPTLESDSLGTRILFRNSSGRLQLFRHVAGQASNVWRAGASGIAIGSTSIPAATLLESGELVSATESNTTNHVVTVQRWSADGAVTSVVTTMNGYAQPTISSDGVRVWVVAVRSSDGAVISRRVIPPSSGASSDVVEIAPSELDGGASYPNALRRADDRLRFVVRGPRSGTSRSSVLASQRPL